MAETTAQTITIDTSPEDEEALLQAARQNPAAFQELYQKWLSPLYRYFYFRVGNAKDAEDLTSQVFLKVYEGLSRYQDHGRFIAWLFTIARSKAADYYRSHAREVPLDSIENAPLHTDYLSQAIQSDEIQRLTRLIRALPEDEQELIRLRFVAELRYSEIGQVLHRKEDAVRKTITRLLDRLHNQLEAGHE